MLLGIQTETTTARYKTDQRRRFGDSGAAMPVGRRDVSEMLVALCEKSVFLEMLQWLHCKGCLLKKCFVAILRARGRCVFPSAEIWKSLVRP